MSTVGPKDKELTVSVVCHTKIKVVYSLWLYQAAQFWGSTVNANELKDDVDM